ncbi:PepSY domain-containing protein [Jiulongibacter sp. NS-SX5]|uniref:PepSY domain-containing protein n=1 Tax=Jiulongibacter sp. NS-SX5 TaxID=3463854 RepID=UPI004058DC46
MINKGWRKLHYMLALIAGLLIFLASGTGLILSVEPFVLHKYAVSGEVNKDLSFEEFRNTLQEEFLEVFSLEKDAYGNIKVEGIGMEADGTFYLSGATGELVEAPQKVAEVFNFSRDLHRSLFLKTPGRIMMGLAAFAMLFLAVSGIALLIKRAGGFKSLLKSIPIVDFNRDRHAYWSRLFLIPIVFIAGSGVYLSLDRFAELSKETITPINSGPSLSEIKLSEVNSVLFPVMEEEPLIIETNSGEAHYVNGELLEYYPKSVSENLAKWSFVIHTGEGSRAIALLLGLSSVVLIFLTYTGFVMLPAALKKRGAGAGQLDEKDFIIAVGSETGHTWRFAEALSDSLKSNNIDHALVGINQLKKLTGSKTVVFLSSTYGDGEAPENAADFEGRLPEIFAEIDLVKFAVLGFGSTDYEAYCAYAKDLRNQLVKLENSQELVPYETVNNRSVSDFIEWVKALNKRTGFDLQVKTEQLKPTKRTDLHSFEIIENRHERDVHLLRIKMPGKTQIKSGDLLGVYPPEEAVARYYSVAVLESTGEIVLMIKKTGLCSSYLCDLYHGQNFKAYVKLNPSFYKPEAPVIMISNGTGLAPFLGMKTDADWVFWGSQYQKDADLFSQVLEFDSASSIYSREGNSGYVQDLLLANKDKVTTELKNGASIMVCGSLTMLKGVKEALNQILDEGSLPNYEDLRQEGRVLVDCY